MSVGKYFKKIVQLLQTERRPPPPRFGDGKYDSEEDENTLKAGIIKELNGRQMSIPEDLDDVLELIKHAKAGELNVTPLEMVRIGRVMLIVG
jgi:hypothetical protein